MKTLIFAAAICIGSVAAAQGTSAGSGSTSASGTGGQSGSSAGGSAAGQSGTGQSGTSQTVTGQTGSGTSSGTFESTGAICLGEEQLRSGLCLCKRPCNIFYERRLSH